MKDLYEHCFDPVSEFTFLGCYATNGINPLPTLTQADFYNGAYGRMYSAFQQGDFVPTPTILARYNVERDLWMGAIESIGSDAQGMYHGMRVARLSAIRAGIKTRTDEITKLSAHPTEDQDEIAALVGATSSGIVLRDSRSMADGALRSLSACANGFSLSQGVLGLHNWLRAWIPGEQWIIGASSGVGKTSLAMQLCEQYRTLFISGEMPDGGLARRYHGMDYWGRVERSREFEQIANEEDQERDFRLAQTDGRIYNYFREGWQYVTRPMTLAEIDKAVSVAKRDHGCDIFLIDYLQLMRGSSKDRRNDVAEIARGTKQIAMKYGVRSLLLSQLSRPTGTISTVDPATVPVNLGRLKESGDIEESADGILGMWLHQSRTSTIQVVQDIKNRQLGVHPEKYMRRFGPLLRMATDYEVQQVAAESKPAKKQYTYNDSDF